MAVFAWKGINSAGKDVKGVRDADSPKALKVALKREGVMVTEILENAKAKQKSAREIDFGAMFRRISPMDIAVATRQLAVLLKAGIPLVEGLSALIDQLENPELRAAFTTTRNRVNEGASFADALRDHPKYFNHLYVSMVEAGEASGTLEAVLARLADFLESSAKLRSKVQGALAYPALMAIMGVLVILIMMTVVVPEVTSIFEDFDQTLPWYTRVLIFFSNIFSDFWYLLILLTGAAVFAFVRWKATADGRKKWDIIKLKLPLFGKLLLMVAVTRFARTLATLLSSGVPVLQAMEITKNVLGNTELTRVVEDARESVREGESIAVPLKRSGRFPPIVTHMIAIGEKSGELEQMLENVASAYDAQVEARLQAMTSVLEPILIVTIGGAAGFIAFSIMMPLVQINEFIQ